MFVLRCFSLSPFCRYVRLTLHETKIAHTIEFEKHCYNQSDLMRLPVLQTETDQFSDARAICEYLTEMSIGTALLPNNTSERAHIRSWINRLQDEFWHSVTGKVLQERYFKRYRDSDARQPDLETLKTAWRKRGGWLKELNENLHRNGVVVGTTLSLADLAAAAQLSSLDYFGDVPWVEHPHVREWYARLKSRPAFRPLLSDQLPGYAPAQHYADLDF